MPHVRTLALLCVLLTGLTLTLLGMAGRSHPHVHPLYLPAPTPIAEVAPPLRGPLSHA